ncbi:MAG: hypothetical protein IPK07_16070 [Deltaproteobacteria bacterium]|nr:hypothetical protein [Deltaproteobacteria bacterium]
MSMTQRIRNLALAGLAATLVTSGAACSKSKKEETPKPPRAAAAPKLADAAKAANQLAGDAAAVPIEERKKRFVARTTKRIDELTKRIPAIDAKVRGLDPALANKWSELKPGLDAKLAEAKKDFDAYLASPTDEAFGQARPKIRRVLGSIEDTLDAAESVGAAANGAVPAAGKPAAEAG